ncbi:MAG: hypothetical protein M0Z80_09245 [Treponema sp.]|nr:hypothetical protein [Treponema sp.]
MDSDLRASLAAAGAAFALSALVGLFARVAFLALIGRAVLGGLLIGAIVYGAIRLFRALLLVPEASGDAEMPEQRGHNLDIVLPEEMPGSFGAGTSGLDLESMEEEGGESPEDVLPVVEAAPRSAGSAFASAEGEPNGSPAEFEASEQGLPARKPGAAPRSPAPVRSSSASRSAAARAFADYEEDDIGEAESLLDEVPDSRARVADVSSSPLPGGAEGFNDLDVLPDLEGFTDSFAASEYGVMESASDNQGPVPAGRAASGRSSGVSDLDPATLAQAVRTILKKDRKG